MTPREWIDTYDGELLVADGFDDAMLGVAEVWVQHKKGGASRIPVVVYDRDRCIRILVERDGMTAEEAEEYFAFNTADAYVGEQTPIYVERPPEA